MKLSIQTAALLALCAGTFAQAQDADVLATPYQDIKTPPPPPPVKDAPPHGVETDTATDTAAVPPPLLPEHRTISVGRGYLAGLDDQRVHYDEPGDGRIWAAGNAYKASFGREGATYIPFFGSRAPRNFPVAFHIAGLHAGGEPISFDKSVAPVRDGDRIVFDRGGVTEVWDLRPDSVEQSFVFRAQLSGEIVIDLAVDSELERSSDADGMLLSSELGFVRYGRAFAIDAHVGRTEIASGWQDGAIRMRVPADRVAAAAWPLVVDPIVTTFAIDETFNNDTNPDVAYNAATQHWMTVYERVFSATESDVVYDIRDANGVFVKFGAFDLTSTNWANPRVANNGLLNRFLCVAQVGATGSRIIRCRYREAATDGLQGPALTVSGSETGDKYNPDVGGNPNAAIPAYFCVVWQRDYSATDQDILARFVTGGGGLAAGVIFLSNSGGTLDSFPSVSNTCGMEVPGSDPRWYVVWQRRISTLDHDLMGAEFRDDSALLHSQYYIDSSSANTFAASVSSPTNDTLRTYMVTAMRRISAFGDDNTHGWAMRSFSLVDSASLTHISGSIVSERQYYPSVDCDGDLFFVADQETFNGTLNYNVHLSTFHVIDNEILSVDGHVSLATSTTSEGIVELACVTGTGSPARKTMLVWQDAGTSDGQIEGALVQPSSFTSLCTPGSVGVLSCPCGNPPSGPNRGCNNSSGSGGASITATGTVSPDTVHLQAVHMQPSTLCLFVQGTGFDSSGTAFGDGVRCVNGSLVRLATKAASLGGAQFPAAGDPSITQRAAAAGAPIAPGTSRYYFAYYRDVGNYACAATFNTTDVVRVLW